MIVAEIIKKSVYSHKGIDYPITSFKLRYPRIVHQEVMTHRSFSRNASSSRAIPFDKQIDYLKDNISRPSRFGSNQPGMQDRGQSHESLVEIDEDTLVSIDSAWDEAAYNAINIASSISDAGYHKQVANRIIEPFTDINVIVTCTDLDNFYALRCDSAADPTIQELAQAMYEEDKYTEAEHLPFGGYHLPFIDVSLGLNGEQVGYYLRGTCEEVTLKQAIKISVSVCAQVSYRKEDFSIERANKIFDMLVNSDLIHASPFEHVARAFSKGELEKRIDLRDQFMSFLMNIYEEDVVVKMSRHMIYCNNFRGYYQYRIGLNNETITNFKGVK